MTQALIASFKNIGTTKGLNIIFEKASFIFGIFHTKKMYIISLFIKSYVYRKRHLQENISVQELLIDFKTHLTTLKYNVIQQCQYNNFVNERHNLLFLLSKS